LDGQRRMLAQCSHYLYNWFLRIACCTHTLQIERKSKAIAALRAIRLSDEKAVEQWQKRTIELESKVEHITRDSQAKVSVHISILI
jgi:hypothetical protein